jgi:hypothetical protein
MSVNHGLIVAGVMVLHRRMLQDLDLHGLWHGLWLNKSIFNKATICMVALFML